MVYCVGCVCCFVEGCVFFGGVCCFGFGDDVVVDGYLYFGLVVGIEGFEV